MSKASADQTSSLLLYRFAPQHAGHEDYLVIGKRASSSMCFSVNLWKSHEAIVMFQSAFAMLLTDEQCCCHLRSSPVFIYQGAICRLLM